MKRSELGPRQITSIERNHVTICNNGEEVNEFPLLILSFHNRKKKKK